jgi:hypothetical protein
LKGLHEIVINGMGLIEAQNGIKRCFDQWVSVVTGWLNQNGSDKNMSFEWFSLNLVDTNESLDLSYGDEKLLAYLDKVSTRYKWLAKLPNAGKLPSESRVRITLKQSVKSFGKKNADMISTGINGLDVKDFNQAHINFLLWPRTVAEKLNDLSPESGFDAEWLSLPVMTFYINKSVIGGRKRYNYLVDVVADRIRWLGKLIGINPAKYLSQLAMLKEKPKQLEASLDRLFDGIVVPTKTKAPMQITPLHRELSGKEWLTLAELSIYTGYAKKTLYNWSSAGKLPSSKPHGKLLFKRIEVDNWLIKNSGYLRNGYKKGNTSPKTGEK